MTAPSHKLLIIGLDSAPPELVFDRFLPDLPNIRALIESGVSGPMASTVPPITVPAWACMMTGKDPGTLGIYGLRNRPDYAYDRMVVVDSRWVREPTLWQLASQADRKVILVGLPQTYPVRPVNGCLVSSFLTPDTESVYTYPAELRDEVEQVAPGYMLDVPDFRTDEKDRILRQIRQMTALRFRLTRHLLESRSWDLAVHVEMGTDRINHAFWRYQDESHRKHEPASPYRNAIRDYYRYLDGEIGALIEAAGPDAAVMLVSDHGAKRIDGGLCINEWLIREGDLRLKRLPESATPLENCDVDWSHTRAWGAGGYYARVFLNVAGREPKGAVPAADYGRVRDELAARIAAIPDAEGRPLDTRIYVPERVYRTCRGVPPDLIVYLDDLRWRSVGTVGSGAIHAAGNDTGPDDANHAQEGIFALRIPGAPPQAGKKARFDILDVAPTALAALGMPVPGDMQGRSVLDSRPQETGRTAARDGEPDPDTGYTDEEQRVVEERLRSLGYL